MTEPRNNARKTRGRPFAPGNPGRPRGARNKATLAVEALLDGEAAELARKAIDMAKGGDATALRLCLERICPPRRDRPVSFDLPPISTPADASGAMAGLLAAVAKGDLTPSEAQAVADLIGGYVKAVEVAHFDARLAALEAKLEPKD